MSSTPKNEGVETISEIAKTLATSRSVEPFEWHQLLCRFECPHFQSDKQEKRLGRESFGLFYYFEGEDGVEYDHLYHGATERTLGISIQESDLRLAEFLARRRIKPTLVFHVIRERHRDFEQFYTHDGDPVSDRYIESVVHRVYQLLFDEALCSNRAQIIDEARHNELYSILLEDDNE